MTGLPVRASFADGAPALVHAGRRFYLACWPDEHLLAATLRLVLVDQAGLSTVELPPHVRLRRRGNLTFAFNYGPDAWQGPPRADYGLGGPSVEPQGLAC